ncbi:MAG: trigger factor family protein, partial [Candidatus Omnitrophica bacterium]|nr:trigger factor family protein [Candidatus Omnitrophota bacterium]
MRVETKKIDKLKRRLKIEVEGDEFTKEKEAIFRESSKNLKVPGFRPGSAPLDVLEKYHSGYLKEELLKKALPVFYQKALEEAKLTPAGYPHISDIDLKPQSIVFFAELEVKPDVLLKDAIYKGLAIKGKKVEVQEIEIEKVITNLHDGVQKTIGQKLNDEELARWASYPDAAALR